ncbi:MAG TPA: FkbM family methyltransferase [Caulobacteraceae bacterium]|jgi:FkbM family methyltransferase|nr:FkbM family methyltransferase [Caulobacteraceae bacterium]
MNTARNLKLIFDHPLNRGAPIATAARVIGWQVRSRLSKVTSAPFANGARLLVSRRMYGATGNVYCGLHEFEEMAFLLHFLRPGDVFADVGANIGSYSMLAGSVGAHAVAFEPGERFEDLERNAGHNGYDTDCRRQAVGDRNGVIAFTVGLDAMNHVAEPGGSGARAEVPITRLDDALDQAVLIKVDTEGFEAAVVAGGQRVFAGASAAIMELDAGADAEPMRTLTAMGYRPANYDPFTRQLLPFHKTGNNSLLIRGDIEPRLKSAPAFTLRGRSI